MTLWETFSLIKLICNKDYSGNIITPNRFNELIKVVNIELFRNKYGLPEEYQPGRPVPNEYVDITLKNTDDLKAFRVSLIPAPVTSGVLPYPVAPVAYAHRDTIVYNYIKTIKGVATSLPRPVEILKGPEFDARQGNYTKRPTTMNPIGTVRSNGIHIRPATITSVDFYYFRFPVEPVFAYNQFDGYITEDSANSIQFEWVVDEHYTLVKMILSMTGIHLREDQIINYAELKLQKG